MMCSPSSGGAHARSAAGTCHEITATEILGERRRRPCDVPDRHDRGATAETFGTVPRVQSRSMSNPRRIARPIPAATAESAQAHSAPPYGSPGFDTA